jgi:hypothetical protein
VDLLDRRQLGPRRVGQREQVQRDVLGEGQQVVRGGPQADPLGEVGTAVRTEHGGLLGVDQPRQRVVRDPHFAAVARASASPGTITYSDTADTRKQDLYTSRTSYRISPTDHCIVPIRRTTNRRTAQYPTAAWRVARLLAPHIPHIPCTIRLRSCIPAQSTTPHQA